MQKPTQNTDLDNSLWQYACKVYQQPNVATHLLRLQDEYALNVNIILMMFWLGHKKILLNGNQLSGFISSIETIDDEVIKPLRKLRISLKNTMTISTIYYEQIKKLELSLEQQLISILHQHFLHNSFSYVNVSCMNENFTLYTSLHSPQILIDTDFLLSLDLELFSSFI